MKNNNNPVFNNTILDYKSNYLNQTLLNQKPEKLKKKKVRKFLRIKRKIKANKNIKRITNKNKNKNAPKGNKNKQISTLSILSPYESLVGSLSSSSSIQLSEEEKFDSEKFRIDLLNSNHNNNNNRINIEGNCDSEENIQYLRNETIFIGLSFDSKSLIHKEL